MASCDHHHDKFVSPMDFSAQNLSAAWDAFKDQFEVFILAKGIWDKPEKVQIANLLMKMGAESVPISKQFIWATETKTEGSPPATTTTTEEQTLKKVIAKFDAHFRPVKNVILERVQFNQLCQLQGQSVHDYITSVRTHADNCDYGDMKDELVRDKIVVGLKDPELRMYLINLDQELTLDVCIRKSKQWVMQQKGLADIKPSCPVGQDVDAVESTGAAGGAFRRAQFQKPKTASGSASECRTCGRASHRQGSVCPAVKYNMKCHNCSKSGHYSRVCSVKTGAPMASVDAEYQSNMIDSL